MTTALLIIQIGEQKQQANFVDNGGDIQVSCTVTSTPVTPTVVVRFAFGKEQQDFYFSGVKTCPHPTHSGQFILDEAISVRLGAVSIELNCDRDVP